MRSEASTPPTHRWAAGLAWAAIAVAVRLLIAWAVAASGLFSDMVQYHGIAQHLLRTGTVIDAVRGPGYPAALAGVYAVLGESFWSARVLNALLAGATCLLTCRLAIAAGAGRRAHYAAAIVALYPGLVLSSVYVMPEGLYTFLIAAALALAAHTSPLAWAAAGAIGGAAMLTRSVGIATCGSAAAIVAWRAWRGDWRWSAGAGRIAAFAIACLVVLAPWLRFTTRMAGGPLLDQTSGMNVLLGNHPGATGRLDLADESPLRRQYVDGAASAADGNRRALRAGLAWAAANPGSALPLLLKKLAFLFGLEGREHAWLYGNGYFGARAPATVTIWGLLLMVSFPVLLGGAVMGTARALKHEAALVGIVAFVLGTAALHMASFGESRFHLPLVPLLAVLAVLPHGRQTAPAPARRPVTALAGVVMLLAIAAWATQTGELMSALRVLRTPDGWQSGIGY